MGPILEIPLRPLPPRGDRPAVASVYLIFCDSRAKKLGLLWPLLAK